VSEETSSARSCKASFIRSQLLRTVSFRFCNALLAMVHWLIRRSAMQEHRKEADSRFRALLKRTGLMPDA